MQNNVVIFKDLTTDEKISEIEEQSKQYQGLVVDMDKAAERKKVKDSASLINGMLKKLDRARIDKSKDYKAKVEAEAESIKIRLEKANEPLTVLIDAHAEKQRVIREAEKARVAKIDEAFVKLNDSALEAVGQTVTVIESIIEDIESYDFDPDVFQERTNEAVDKQAELLGKLNGMLEGAKLQEENEAKLARLAAFEAKEEQERIAKLQAERDADIKRAAEIDKLAAIEQAKIDAKEEQKKIEAEEVERLRKLEANKKHAGMVRGEIKSHLMQECRIDENTATSVVKALLKTNRITINY